MLDPGDLSHEGFEIDYEGNLPRGETLRRLPDYDALITRSRSPRNRKCAFGYGSDWARTNNSMSAALAVKSIRDSRSERLWKYVARAGSCW